MVEIDTGGPAFPVPANEPIHSGSTGMMLRDYFAAMTITGCLPGPHTRDYADFAAWAYQMADAMLEARK